MILICVDKSTLIRSELFFFAKSLWLFVSIMSGTTTIHSKANNCCKCTILNVNHNVDMVKTLMNMVLLLMLLNFIYTIYN